MIHERILIVDSDPQFRSDLRAVLTGSFPELSFSEADTGEQAWQTILRAGVRMVFCNCHLPDMDCLELVHRIRLRGLSTLLIAISDAAELSQVVRWIRAGAFDFLPRPFSPETLLQIAQGALDHLRANRVILESLAPGSLAELFWGESPAMRQVLELVRQVAPTQSTVLITGESGTGKELVAREIHRQSRRADRPLVVVDCGTLPSGLVESELFGHLAGAFTGADKDKTGLFEVADAGTLLLDEIGEFPIEVQVKVLRALQDGEIRPVGSDRTRRLDLRVIAATNRDLEAEVAAGRFRKDLYYRLNVVRIPLPPLRERLEEIGSLVSHFLSKYQQEYHHQIRGLSKGALAMLRNYPWPGNVRELEHTFLQLMILHGNKRVIEESDLPLFLERRGPERKRRFFHDALEVQLSLEDYTREFVRLHENRYTERELARALGITPKTLWQKRRKWNLKRRSRVRRKNRN
ncbi:MAG: hypothetical protein A2V67_10870 [Deltaproteobacteria bacterium RBG_13_61_14]|nr:MAG: hypothetical protein A2V67_10870 [Deltaproteobacteria bacterium RBG_13_61_14]